MKSCLFLYSLAILILSTDGFLAKKPVVNTTEHRVLATVKIYSNLAEIIKPLGKLPLEFSADDWSDIRDDSITLVGSNVSITQQTITEKKKSLNNAQVYVRSPSSSNTETKFIKATVIDEKRNLVKLIDKDISKEPIYFTASSDNIVYDEEPPQTQYYVNFTYDTSDAVYVSYLRSNLNWKTGYQLNLFDEPKSPVLIAMADIRNDGQSKIDIEHAELLGGDINLKKYQQQQFAYATATYDMAMSGPPGLAPPPSPNRPSVGKAEEISGLYVFPINHPFSIEGKTNYLLPMFRSQVTIERFGSISKYFYGATSSNGKAQRSYRLSSDRYLSRGNCIIRESDRLAGETSLPNLAAKDKHEFSIGEDADVIYKENATLVSTRAYNETVRRPGTYGTYAQERTESVYNVNVLFKNFKKNRPVKVEYQQQVSGQSVKLLKPNTVFTQEDSTIKYALTLAAGEEKQGSYKIEVIT